MERKRETALRCGLPNIFSYLIMCIAVRWQLSSGTFLDRVVQIQESGDVNDDCDNLCKGIQR